jgi:hypothetical protein
MWGDYSVSSDDQPWALEVNEWILQGFTNYHTRTNGSNNKSGRMPIGAAILRMPKSNMTVFVSILDYGGDSVGRPFPMCFYVGVPTPMLPGPTSETLSAAGQVIHELFGLRKEIATFLHHPGSLQELMEDRCVDLSGLAQETDRDSWMVPTRDFTMGEWFDAAQDGLTAPSIDTYLRAVAWYGKNIAAMNGQGFEPTFRFPLARGKSLTTQLAGWLRWLEGRLDLGSRTYSVMLTGDSPEAPGTVSTVFRELEPDDFMLLTNAASTLPYLDDLVTLGSKNVPCDDYADCGISEGSTWFDFVSGTSCE